MLLCSALMHVILLYLQGVSVLQGLWHLPSAIFLSLMSAVLSGLFPAMCCAVAYAGVFDMSATSCGR